MAFDTWEDVIASQIPRGTPNGHGPLIPVLATIPASFGGDGDVHDAYDFEEAVDYLPGTFRDASDPRMFGLIVTGDSMAPKYPEGSWVVCSPQHWQDHGFVDGHVYAVRLQDETTIKRVHLIDGGRRLELVPTNESHNPRRIKADEVQVAALVRRRVIEEAMPETGK